MIAHARSVFGTIALTALAFTAYAGLQLGNRSGSKITSGDAVAIAKKAVGASGCEALLETLSRSKQRDNCRPSI